MSVQYVDTKLLLNCFIAGAKNLNAHKAHINELNVFPVPDGDTGTNMSLTVIPAARMAAETKDVDMGTLVKTISSGTLRNARGNSGVIMSQLLRGFCKTVGNAGTDKIDVFLASSACLKAVDTAYKAVMKPKEGTILTVAKGVCDKIRELAPVTTDMAELLKEAIKCGNDTLQKTPELLPVLKEAGVVDSGGQGLMYFLEGMVDVLEGKDVDLALDIKESQSDRDESLQFTSPLSRGPISTDDIKFGYCTECMINFDKAPTKEQLEGFMSFLESTGDSIVCVPGDDFIKVHVHTNHPGLIFEKGLELGTSLSHMKVDNMREEHEEKLIANASLIASNHAAKETTDKKEKDRRKSVAFVAVCCGKGFKRIFEEIGDTYVLEGGQTMNPSTEDILEAVYKADADEVYIFPNNKNIILSCEQAAKMSQDVLVHVVHTKTIPEGVTAIINFTQGTSAEQNIKAMQEAIQTVKTGELTYAVRDTLIDGLKIKEGDWIGIGDRGILSVGQIVNDTAFEMLEKMIDEDSSLVTIYYGENMDHDSARMLSDALLRKHPDLSIEVEDGGQPVYYYIVSVE